jgi:hypothetical protein
MLYVRMLGIKCSRGNQNKSVLPVRDITNKSVLFKTKMDITLTLISNIRKDKKGHCAQEDYVNTLKTKPISLTGIFYLGIYYTRDEP